MPFYLFLVMFILIAIFSGVVYKSGIEGFSSTKIPLNPDSSFFKSFLVGDIYTPSVLASSNEISNVSEQEAFNRQPKILLGSYIQETNNVEFPKNPDNGTAGPMEMGYFYEDQIVQKSPIVKQLSAPEECGTNKVRVGYYCTQKNNYINEF